MKDGPASTNLVCRGVSQHNAV